jgi:[ribosomal protein S18]-alanine N-acetyltransferase
VYFFSAAGGLTVEKRVAPALLCQRLQWRVPFEIRDSKPDEFETLWWIDQQCFAPEIAYSRQELRTYMRRHGAFTLVAANVAVNAVANSGANHDGLGGFLVAQGGVTGHIITIDVLKSARRAGVGSLLLRSAEERLAAAGSKAVGLETAVDNLAALTFYKRHGYNVVRTWPHYYANGVDALVLEKRLPPPHK